MPAKGGGHDHVRRQSLLRRSRLTWLADSTPAGVTRKRRKESEERKLWLGQRSMRGETKMKTKTNAIAVWLAAK